jgi:hypothetical protein
MAVVEGSGKDPRALSPVAPRQQRDWRDLARAARGLIANRSRRRFWRLINKALQIAPRGFISHDELVLTRLSGHLRLGWLARIPHPWERRPWSKDQDELLRRQTIRDTERSVIKFFETLPDIDALDVNVREPRPPHRVILAGTVLRDDALAARSLMSPEMRIKMMGLRWVACTGVQSPPLG